MYFITKKMEINIEKDKRQRPVKYLFLIHLNIAQLIFYMWYKDGGK